jgi:hypothetical protein
MNSNNYCTGNMIQASPSSYVTDAAIQSGRVASHSTRRFDMAEMQEHHQRPKIHEKITFHDERYYMCSLKNMENMMFMMLLLSVVQLYILHTRLRGATP